MNYHKIDELSISNGFGARVVLWVSGCSLHCKGCHNPQSWDFTSGKTFDKDAKQELFESLNKPYIKGITFSGGHPLEPENRGEILNLILDIKTKMPHKDIWLYTGYTLSIDNFINEMSVQASILNLCDIVVDGEYKEELRDITLSFCGSSNQRIIDVKKTVKNGEITLYK